jgi:hypothetical protein
MSDEALIDDHTFTAWRPAAPARPRLVVLVAVLTWVISAAVCVAAILAPAPPVVIPLVVAICVGCPIFAGWEVPNAVAALRAKRAGRVLVRLRRSLDELPETEHPLGL